MGLDRTKIRAVILDMDGVLWRGHKPIGNLPAIFKEMDQLGWKVILATNNPSATVEQFLEKLLRFGVVLRPDQIITSTVVASQYLKAKYPDAGPIYIIGEPGMVETFERAGFSHSSRENVLAVVAGIDRQLSYEKLKQASLLIRSGKLFIGTNPDKTFPVPEGLAPGTGSIIAAIEAATGTQATIMGKPMPEMYKVCLQRLGSSPEETLVIGDRLETDILGGQTLGCRTALVLSGVTTEEAAAAWTPNVDWIGQDLTSLIFE